MTKSAASPGLFLAFSDVSIVIESNPASATQPGAHGGKLRMSLERRKTMTIRAALRVGQVQLETSATMIWVTVHAFQIIGLVGLARIPTAEKNVCVMRQP